MKEEPSKTMALKFAIFQRSTIIRAQIVLGRDASGWGFVLLTTLR